MHIFLLEKIYINIQQLKDSFLGCFLLFLHLNMMNTYHEKKMERYKYLEKVYI